MRQKCLMKSGSGFLHLGCREVEGAMGSDLPVIMGIRRVYDVMYVCVGKHTSLENDRYVCLFLVCMYVWGNIHT